MVQELASASTPPSWSLDGRGSARQVVQSWKYGRRRKEELNLFLWSGHSGGPVHNCVYLPLNQARNCLVLHQRGF